MDLRNNNAEAAGLTFRRWSEALALERLLAIFGLGLAVAVVYWPSSRALARIWTDTANRSYTHGFLLLLTSAWLIARDREALGAVRIRPELRALPLLPVLSIAWLLFWHAAIQDAHLLLLPLILYAALLAVLGREAARILLFPVGFLYFAMPVWSDLNGILQLMSIRANQALIWAIGLPAYLDGNIVHLPGGSLEIAEGCSGLHYVIVGLALAALYGELSRGSLRQRLAWLGSMGLLALIANWVRIFVIVVAAYATHMQTYLVTVDHYWFGWGVFAVCFAGWLWVAGRLNRSNLADERTLDADRESFRQDATRVRPVGFAAALLGLAALPALAYGAQYVISAPVEVVAIGWAAAPPGWIGPQSVTSSDWKPAFANATALSERAYVDSARRRLEVFAVAYGAQRQGAKLVAYGNSLLGTDGRLRPVSARSVHSASGDWREWLVADETGAESLIWYRYRIGDRLFTSARISQLWYGLVSIAASPISSLVALRAPCQPNCEQARQRLAGAAATLLPAVHAAAGARGLAP